MNILVAPLEALTDYEVRSAFTEMICNEDACEMQRASEVFVTNLMAEQAEQLVYTPTFVAIAKGGDRV